MSSLRLDDARLSRSTQFYYQQGQCIFVCENIIFQLQKSALSIHSPKLLELSRAARSEGLWGDCSFVWLPDSAEHFTLLLECMCNGYGNPLVLGNWVGNPGFHPDILLIRLYTLCGIAHRYEANRIKEGIVKRLTYDYLWRLRGKDVNVDHLKAFIEMGQECCLPAFLKEAYCSSGFTHPRIMATLDRHHRISICRYRSELLHLFEDYIHTIPHAPSGLCEDIVRHRKRHQWLYPLVPASSRVRLLPDESFDTHLNWRRRISNRWAYQHSNCMKGLQSAIKSFVSEIGSFRRKIKRAEGGIQPVQMAHAIEDAIGSADKRCAQSNI
ncbi:hypothetical protein M422DRAFT_257389 [Sphaerobolus stellatus SS14]|uniref:BTB domain-containing protein n=1 Tax=Sphaerobolus stellatus (strain SS14) TaxID=990650 RepID=A0A0C9U9N5_SPHS4|nr:hypothetical protein M422DRAFT_257389 [Sphaerobolus stellatus SS14]